MLRTLIALLCLASIARADPQIDQKSPSLSLPAADGSRFTLTAGARSVVVDFYATWCGPCHLAIAALDRLAGAGDFELVIVDVGEDPDAVRRHVAEHPLPARAHLVFDTDGATARAWGQHRFPTTFLLDGDLRIRHINRGYGAGYEQRLRGWLASMSRRATLPPSASGAAAR